VDLFAHVRFIRLVAVVRTVALGVTARTIGLGLLAYLLARPLFALTHELLVVGLAGVLRTATMADLWPQLVGRLPLDPIYTLAMVRFTGEISASGVAIAEPLGGVLSAAAPGLFVAPAFTAGAWASAVLEPGATAAARGLVAFGADLIMLVLAVALVRLGLRGRPWLAVLGALQQAHLVVHHFLDGQVSLRDVEAAGLPFAASTLFSNASERAPWFTNELARLHQSVVSLAAGLLMAIVAYLLVGAFFGLARLAAAAGRRLQGNARPFAVGAVRPGWARAGGYAVIVLALALSPLGVVAEAATRVLPDEAPAGPSLATAVLGQVERVGKDGPTQVAFVGRAYDYKLFVDGQPQVVQGMGYNVQYRGLPDDERVRLYDRDFARIRALGVNVIFGWFQDQFDEVMLDAAARHGLGVGVPFELNQDLDYADPAVCAGLRGAMLEQVMRYRSHPAVWFWTPGNEVIHRLIFPSWLRHQTDPAREARADSFARCYVSLIDAIHAIDPDHPVIYRDAEEVYLGRIRDELQRDGLTRPWFAYGANVYTQRLGEILQNWPRQGLDVPLLLAEFAPGGTGPADRPEGLRKMWQTIRAYPHWVMGGAVYAWSSDGPEELDRVFGLVDRNDQPRDAALATIGELFGGAAAFGPFVAGPS
jgi:hypothetical protein